MDLTNFAIWFNNFLEEGQKHQPFGISKYFENLKLQNADI